MRKAAYFAAVAAAAVITASCAKERTAGTNDDNKRYFDAWVMLQKKQHPEYEWRQTALGSWILRSSVNAPVIGEPDDSVFAYINFSITDLDGNYSATTDEKIAQQIWSDFDSTAYYGPKLVFAGPGNSHAGIRELYSLMSPGSRIKAAVPGWLLSYKRYDNAESYLANETGTNSIYDLELIDTVRNTKVWENDSIMSFISRNYPGTKPQSVSDTLGYYYIRQREPSDTASVKKDSTFYINYTGRLLNGKLFDTSIRNVAMDEGIYNSARTYGAMAVKKGSSASLTTLDGSKVISGFGRCLQRLKKGEKGTAIFFSPLGYAANGSGAIIPPYSPLMFEIEVLDKKP